MGTDTKRIAIVSAGVAAAAVLGYLVYFDYKRRHDPELRKQQRRERKRKSKAIKAAENEAKEKLRRLAESLIEAASGETLPSTVPEQEAYFKTHITVGEQLCNKGEEFYSEAAVHFYKALKMYPSPMQLIAVYQNTVPSYVFQVLVNALALERQKRESEFYKQLVPEDASVKVSELPAGQTPEGKPIVRYGLVASKDALDGDVLFTETPFITALHPALEGLYCNYCLQKIEDKVECTNCAEVGFCSTTCLEEASKTYHPYLCTNSKINEGTNAESVFFHYTKDNNAKYPYMIARIFSDMMAEEIEKKTKNEAKANDYSIWDHIDHLRYLKITPSEITHKEAQMIQDILKSKIPGFEEILTDDVYVTLQGKLMYNCYAVSSQEGQETKQTKEKVRVISADEPTSAGAALFKVMTFVGHTDTPEKANAKLAFNDKQQLVVTATQPIESGQEIIAHFELPQPDSE